MTTHLKLRNPLFAPGDSARKAEKALASAADAVILDLEDSVALPQKPEARIMVAALLPTLVRPGVVVRINPPETPFYLADLAAIVPGRPAAVMLPKCAGLPDLLALHHHLEALETAAHLQPGAIGILAIVTETAASCAGLDYRATPAPVLARLRALCFGATPAYPAPIQAARAATLLAAAAIGIPALDTPWPDPADPAGLQAEAATAAADGFAGKLCIHPNQLEPVAAAFTPAPAQVEWARAVQAGFAARPGAGVFILDGKMIDRPHLKLAHRILTAI